MPSHLRVYVSLFSEVLNLVVILDFNGNLWCSGLLEIRSLLYLGPEHGWKNLISTTVLSVEGLSHGNVGSLPQVSPLPSSRVKWGFWGGRLLPSIRDNTRFSMSDHRLAYIPAVNHCKSLNSHPHFTLAFVKCGCRHLSKAGTVTLIWTLLKGDRLQICCRNVAGELWLEVNRRTLSLCNYPNVVPALLS